MAVKYRCEYTSVNDIDYTIDISNDDYVGSVVDIVGSAVYGLNTLEDLTYPIRSKFLRLSLLATTTNELDDLFATNERYWKVELYRGADKLFFGYLSSEQASQSFVTEERFIDFDVLDPLAFLEDLAYVDLSGFTMTGQEQLRKILAKSVRRGFDNQTDAFNIVSYVPYDYRTQSTSTDLYTTYTTGDFLLDVTTNQDAYIDEDSGEALSCKEVLFRILHSLQLTIQQKDGNTWVIGHYLYDMKDIDTNYINYYDKDGNTVADFTTTPYLDVSLKTDNQLNDVDDVIHVNKNQSFFYYRALQKLTTNFEYDYLSSFLENPSFDGGVNGISMPGWSVGGSYSEATDDGYVKVYNLPSGGTTAEITVQSNSGKFVLQEQALKVVGQIEANFDGKFAFNVIHTIPGDVNPTYLYFGGSDVARWGEFATIGVNGSVFLNVVNGEVLDFEYILPRLRGSGTIDIFVWAVNGDVAGSPSNFTKINSLDIVGDHSIRTGETGTGNSVGEYSLKSDSNEIYLDTNRGQILRNQLFKLSIGGSITEIRDNFLDDVNFRHLARIHNNNALNAKKKRRVFSGDFYNFFDIDNNIIIDGFSTNRFIPIEYEFDTYSNIGTHKLEEINITEVNHGYILRTIFSNVIEPKIV